MKPPSLTAILLVATSVTVAAAVVAWPRGGGWPRTVSCIRTPWDEKARLPAGKHAAWVSFHRVTTGRFPPTLADLGDDFVAEFGATPRDGWGRALIYTVTDDGNSCTVISFGADGRPGGAGDARDLVMQLP